ncbi:glutamine-hydrolyzing GMP synthase [Desulfurococcus mucosus]|uniref:GMP synthase (glutamine-hydrolyzing) n=1 Tax=Desulfurococcus mucosus (strain ATCC 35584 / DSM 2162 / JCM 9187 / O7/1) TaxID=765177 RepID=E8R8Q0_DESM0|nr:glutamine-hydrolyzing GMP synthase [Desulfurococcus mucosus]ADV64876.1 GMP synthase (glutamine-hydrolyzing) [Desulfurococcus mucosus DSM 2162]
MTRQHLSRIPGGRVLIVDYGGQYTHLIARRIRELGVYSEIVFHRDAGSLDVEGYDAVILSGSHLSVRSLSRGDLEVAEKILFNGSKPLLGICFGHQLIGYLLGADVASGCGEYGRTRVSITGGDELFNGWSSEETVWMSHGECVENPPGSLRILAVSENRVIAAFKAVVNNRAVYGVQFHPEVHHTGKGRLLFDNFLRIAGARREWRVENYYRYLLDELRREVVDDGVAVVGVSGGIDSTVTALIGRKVFGEKLIPVFVDHGLLREGERESVVSSLEKLGLNPLVVDAGERFISRLEGVVDCEERRRVIGEEFAKIFAEIVEKEGARYFLQGTTYPDIIESGGIRGAASVIKSHHNVGGLPEWFRDRVKVLEPIRYLYKDEVREIARLLNVPWELVERHPYPGPGLAVRIIGSFTRKKLEICRKASRIVEDVLREHGFYGKVWQAFAVVGDDKWVGVKGDARSHGYIVTIRVVESVDGMTADYSRLPYDVLDEISRRITNSIPDVSMVTYAVTSKPPSTIEPC